MPLWRAQRSTGRSTLVNTIGERDMPNGSTQNWNRWPFQANRRKRLEDWWTRTCMNASVKSMLVWKSPLLTRVQTCLRGLHFEMLARNVLVQRPEVENRSKLPCLLGNGEEAGTEAKGIGRDLLHSFFGN